MKQGFMAAIIVLLVIASASAGVEYVYDNIVVGSNFVTGVDTPTGMNDGCTDGYADTVMTMSCISLTVNNSLCEGGTYPYCHPNKPTADKLCELEGYAYANSYVFVYREVLMGASINSWKGNAWSATPSTEDVGYGGGGFDPTTSGTTKYLFMTSVTCCS